MMLQYRVYMVLLLSCSPTAFAQIQWEQIPGPQKANIQHVVTFTSNGEDEILAVINGHYWHSTDYGNTWQSGASGIVGSLSSLKAAGENVAFAHTSAGVFRSTDRGWSWNMLPSPPSSLSEIKSIAPEDSNTTYLAALNGLFRYREISGGVWEQITSPLSDFMNAVAVEFTRNGMLWVAVLNGANVDLFSSSDSGAVFNSLIINVGGIGGPRGVSISSSKSGKLALRIEKDNSETFYLNGIVLGNSWIKLNAPGGSDRALLTYAYWMTDNTLYFNSGRSITDFAYVYSQLKSEDNGSNWQEYNNSLDQGITRIMHRSLSGRLYAVKRKGWGGIQISEDDGVNWRSVGPVTDDVPLTDIHVNRKGVISGSATSDLIFRSELTAGILDSSKLWRPVYIPFDHTSLSVINYFRMDDNMELFAAYQGSGFPGDRRWMSSSVNGGVSWQDISTSPLVTFDSPKELFRLNSGSLLMRGGNRLFRKDVMSVDWSRQISSSGLVQLVYEGADLAVVAKQSADSGSILLSTDDGRTWQEKPALGDRPTGLVISRSGEIIISSLSGIWRSSDQGNSWTPWIGGIDSSGISSIARNNNGIITAISPGREVYYNREGGGRWTVDENLMPPVDSASVYIDDENVVYIVGKSSGLFKSASPIDTVGLGVFPDPIGIPQVIPVPERFKLAQNYPNPFNPTTQIPILLPADADLRVAVYDLLGRQIQVLYSGNASAGVFSLTWDGRSDSGEDVQSGVYVVRATSGAIEKSRKMVLLR